MGPAHNLEPRVQALEYLSELALRSRGASIPGPIVGPMHQNLPNNIAVNFGSAIIVAAGIITPQKTGRVAIMASATMTLAGPDYTALDLYTIQNPTSITGGAEQAGIFYPTSTAGPGLVVVNGGSPPVFIQAAFNVVVTESGQNLGNGTFATVLQLTVGIPYALRITMFTAAATNITFSAVNATFYELDN
jgi:hypothetical protein